MRKLSVYIEINGNNVYVGAITGNSSEDAVFSYDDLYMENIAHRAISISLPLEERTFDAKRTRNYFEGLLPEGFTRRCVAEWMHADENDYLSILSGLGNECLGAIRIMEEGSPKVLPEYRKLSWQEVKSLASEGATESAELVTKSHLSLTGASGKVGLYYDEPERQWYLPIGDAPSTHIVKQSHVRLKRIVANEQLCLLTAKNLGIEIADSFIIHVDDYEDENVLFATKRYDRLPDSGKIVNGKSVPHRLHQEDFAQALGISSSSKYEKNNEGYMKKVFEVLDRYSSNPIADRLKLWDICVFNYLIGNTDNHIKNLSLLYSTDLKVIRLAPAYDIISTMIYESSTENMAMSIHGIYKISEITRASFESEAKNIGLGVKMAMKHFDFLVNSIEGAMKKAKNEMNARGFDCVDEVYEKILKHVKKRICL